MAAGDYIYAADYADLEDASSKRPMGRIVASGTQSIPHNTVTAIAFSGTDEIDTHNQHNPASNNTRVTPLVPGVYEVVGTVAYAGRADWLWLEAGIRQSGTAVPPYIRQQPGTNVTIRSIQVTTKVTMNGSTDSFELVTQHLNTAATAQLTNQSSQYSCVLEWCWLRD